MVSPGMTEKGLLTNAMEKIEGECFQSWENSLNLPWFIHSGIYWAPAMGWTWPSGSDGEESACNVGDLGLIPGWGRYPREGTSTHSRILAWRIPWTEESGGLQSIVSQRVGNDWATNTLTWLKSSLHIWSFPFRRLFTPHPVWASKKNSYVICESDVLWHPY